MILENKNKLLYKIPLAILGLIGAIVIFLLTSRYGAGVSPDSVYYISVARHIADGTGFVGYDGYYFVLQPPLYPVLLAAIKAILYIDPLVSAGYVNAFLFGIIIYLSGLFLLKNLKSLSLVFLGTISVLISYPLIQVSLMAWSESLFILLVLLYLYYLDLYQRRGNMSSLLFLSMFAALACLTRYIGVITILTGVVSILIQQRKIFKEKLFHLIIFLFITIFPIGIWIIRNYFLSGTLVGQRAASSYTLYDNLKMLSKTILPWYLPIRITGETLIVMLLIVIALILMGILHYVVGIGLIKKLNKGEPAFPEGMSEWTPSEDSQKQVIPSLIFALFYSGFILISSTTTAYDHIDNRLLSPIYIPSIFVLFFICDKILTCPFFGNWLTKYFFPKLATILFAAGIIMLMIFAVKNTKYIIKDFIEQSGWEYNSKLWRENTTIQYLNEHDSLKKEYKIYSNAPEAVYILANIEAKWSPAKTMYNSPQLLNTNTSFNGDSLSNSMVCLVWFTSINRNFLFTIDELEKSTNMVKVVKLKDGEIFLVTKK
ncbi:MAG: glycosyltransferase family 39 protein [Ignavibacteriaceae bacterium]